METDDFSRKWHNIENTFMLNILRQENTDRALDFWLELSSVPLYGYWSRPLP